MITLDLPSIRAAYAAGETPTGLFTAIYQSIVRENDPALFIHLRPLKDILADAARLAQGPRELPLFGVPFAIKDNIDLAGVPTTAACPSFAYTPTESALVVQRLIAAGAIPLGKTNLDQFATGLVGTRSPYGTPRNALNRQWVPGGSSAGSASSVAAGLVTFALGTDTAGSGRVPAAFQQLIGLKPTKGWWPTQGVVPAARTCDCVTTFALTVDDAWSIAQVAGGYADHDPYSRPQSPRPTGRPLKGLRVGIMTLSAADVDHPDEIRSYHATCDRLRNLGCSLITIDYQPLATAANLLYEGAFVAERTHAVGEFLATNPADADPTVAAIIRGGTTKTAVQLVSDQHKLLQQARICATLWDAVDCLCLPTTPGIATTTDVAAEPVQRNRRIGTYTNWMNLLDCCGLAVPGDRRSDSAPTGVTLAAPAWHDATLMELGRHLHYQLGTPSGRTTVLPPKPQTLPPPSNWQRVVVVGAHLSGLPLNKQLTDLGAVFEQATTTAPIYRFFALPGTIPAKPGLQRVATDGAAIACEVWRIAPEAYGHFVAAIPSPLGIGTIALTNNDNAQGFICEAWALAGATDITHFGEWRAYMGSLT